MAGLRILRATVEHIPVIQELSKIVWPVTFASILSQEQITYMMEMMYSTESLIEQFETNNNYALAQDEEDNFLGYMSFESHIAGEYTKIHKIYVLPDTQGKGVGYSLVKYAMSEAKNRGDKFLYLNVNRYNDKAISFYQRVGFTVSKIENIDIGNGFLMEDYVMVLPLT